MLSEDQKHQIKLEEIYRGEVRKSLAPRKRPKEKCFSFLNSPFGLWILSSIFLAALTSMWSVWNSTQQQERQNTEQIAKIKIEINHRLSAAEQKLDNYLSDTRDNTLINELSEALYPAIRPAGVDFVVGRLYIRSLRE